MLDPGKEVFQEMKDISADEHDCRSRATEYLLWSFCLS